MNLLERRLYVLLLLSFVFPGLALGQRPVSFLHGMDRPASDWIYAMEQLRQQYHFSATLPSYTANSDIPSIASHLHEGIQPNSVVVGHSMGGIIGREMVRRYGTSRVSALITAGSPHNGALILNSVASGALPYYIDVWSNDLAVGWYSLGYGFGLVGNLIRYAGIEAARHVSAAYTTPAARDLRPNSPFMQVLNSNPGATLPEDHYAIYGIEDPYPLPRIAGALIRSDHTEGPAFGVYAGVAGLYFSMAVLTHFISSRYYQYYLQYGSMYAYSASIYWANAASGFFHGFNALAQYIPLEWHYLTTGSTSFASVDGVLHQSTAAPSFFQPQRRLVAPQANHQELLGHPNALSALRTALTGSNVPRR